MTTVLLVEDEMLIALDLELTLRDLGMQDVHVANSVDEALVLLASREIALAIIDYHLGAETAEPVLHGLEARGVPFLVMAGHHDHARLGAGLWPLLAKPATAATLGVAIAALRAARG